MKKCKHNIFLILLILLFIAPIGCSRQKLELWPRPEHIKSLRSAKVVRIVVNQTYEPKMLNKILKLPFEKITKKLLKYAGLKTVSANAEKYDITLKIDSKGEPLYNSYQSRILSIEPSKRFKKVISWSGADISGTISLEIQGILVCQTNFRNHKSPPGSISTLRETADKAPFLEALIEDGSRFGSRFGYGTHFICKILEIMGKVYGYNCIINAFKNEKEDNLWVNASIAIGRLENPEILDVLIAISKDKNEDKYFRRWAMSSLWSDLRACKALIELLKDNDDEIRETAARLLLFQIYKRTFVALIEALKDKKHSVRYFAKESLRQMTMGIGEWFNSDYEKWLEWWNKNKEKIYWSKGGWKKEND
jgi:hypothetical protein